MGDTAMWRRGVRMAVEHIDRRRDQIRREHTKRGRLTKQGSALVDLLDHLGTEIWRTSERHAPMTYDEAATIEVSAVAASGAEEERRRRG